MFINLEQSETITSTAGGSSSNLSTYASKDSIGTIEMLFLAF